MATWEVKGDISVGSPHAFHTSAAYILSDTGAAYLGGGLRSANTTAITVNTWNSCMHIYDTSGGISAAYDKCGSPHLNLCRVCEDTAGSFYPNDTSAPDAFTATHPTSGYGFKWHFWHDVSCEVNPAQFWIGSGADATGDQSTAYFKVTELLKTTPAWAAGSPDSKYTLQNKTTSTGHAWYIAFGCQPLEVGINNSNKMKVSITYS